MILTSGMCGVLPTDKDGGFAVLRKIAWLDPVGSLLQIAIRTREMATYASDKPDHRLFHMSNSGEYESNVTLRVGRTAKTHKSQGNCKIRLLHCMAPLCPFKPMNLTAAASRPQLISLQQFVKDSRDFLKRSTEAISVFRAHDCQHHLEIP